MLLYAFEKAKETLLVQVYGISDTQILESLHNKSLEGVKVQIFYDPTASPPLCSTYHYAIPINRSGLMHKKIACIDEKMVFIGTANFTPTSLCMHDNILMGIYSPALAYLLMHGTQQHYTIALPGQELEFWHLPDIQHRCLEQILTSIRQAQHSIEVALFTFTHPQILDELIEAHHRGITIKIALDYYSATGSSKQALQTLQQAGIEVYISARGKLLHHKFCVIDHKMAIIGSANWTKSAFAKNEDCIIFLHRLSDAQAKDFARIWQSAAISASKGNNFPEKPW